MHHYREVEDWDTGVKGNLDILQATFYYQNINLYFQLLQKLIAATSKVI